MLHNSGVNVDVFPWYSHSVEAQSTQEEVAHTSGEVSAGKEARQTKKGLWRRKSATQFCNAFQTWRTDGLCCRSFFFGAD